MIRRVRPLELSLGERNWRKIAACSMNHFHDHASLHTVGGDSSSRARILVNARQGYRPVKKRCLLVQSGEACSARRAILNHAATLVYKGAGMNLRPLISLL